MGGRAKCKKKTFAHGKIKRKKIHARQLTLRNIHAMARVMGSCYGLKKNSYKEFDNEKKFLRLEIPLPPHNFSNGPSLKALFVVVVVFLW